MILDFEFEEEENFGYEFEQGEEFNMEPLDERTDLFPVRSVDGVKADPAGNIDLTETRDAEIARQLKAMQESGVFDGEDGYTPIKGKDYFDGKDGKTPVKGVDYFDGKDGYTPVKGKDYFDGKDGISPTVGVSPIDGGYKVTITDKDGSRTIDLMNGSKGDDGFSPDVNVTDIANGKKITITDARCATTFYLYDGEDGYTPEKGKDYTDGKDGVSPTVDITDIAGGHRIAITDKDGTNSFDVMNGEGAGDVTSAMLAAAVANHNTAGDSHNDLRLLIDAIAVPTKPSDIGAQPAGDYITAKDVPQEVMIVNIASKTTDGTTTYSSDKTAFEIRDAVSAGMLVVARYNGGFYPIVIMQGNNAVFRVAFGGLSSGSRTTAITITSQVNGNQGVLITGAYLAASGDALTKGSYIVGNGTGSVVLKTPEEVLADIGAQPAGNYLTTETDPTVPSWAKAANKPSYSASEVGADPAGTASGAVSTHNDASNAHSALFNKKANDYSLEIYNGTGGNPKPVRFLTVGYDTCNSENGVAIKIGMVSGHGNGSSYAFLEDVIVRVNYQGGVSVDNFKYYGADAGTYDGAARQYGDIFWVNDTTNKLVTFYVLMGQYARVNMIPYKRLTYSTGGTITQPTSNAVYSSGEKVWANNSEIALMSDIPAVPSWAKQPNKPSYTAAEVGARPNTWTPSASDIGLKTENWTFTLEDGSTVTKAVYVG